MPVFHRVGTLWRNLFDMQHVDRDLDDELRSYQDMLADEHARSGMNLPDARRKAAVETGGIEQIKEQVREVRIGFSIDTLSRDVRFAMRMLFKQPTFSLTVVSLLAIGIAGTTTIFSVFNSLYLRPLPFEEPERLVYLDEKAPLSNGERGIGIAYPDFDAWRERNQVFEGIAVFYETSRQISDESRAETVRVGLATHDLLQVLKIRPQLGRWFLPDEDKPNGPDVAVLSDQLWQTRFGESPDVIGQTIRIDAQPHTIVGVLPSGVDFPNRTEIWMPVAQDRSVEGWWLGGIARLKPGLTAAQAEDDLLRIHKGMIESRNANKATSPTVSPLVEWYVGNFRQATMILLGAVGLVLLIACANIAGIMLARGSARAREMGIRTALGAPRSRIIRQLFTESLLLGALGGSLGIVLGFQGLRGLVALMPPNQLPGWVRFDLDVRLLAFCPAVSIGSAVLFGLWPAWNASRGDVRAGLQDAGPRTSESAERRRSLNILITAEVALAAVLLTAAGLLIQAFRNVERVDAGFRADSILTYQILLPRSKYQSPEQQGAFVEELVTRHRALPGVRSAAVTSATPLGEYSGAFFDIEHAPPRRPGDPNPLILQRVVTPGYLEAMKMTLRSGRTFSDADGRSEGTAATIVNETFARLHWAGQDAIGKRIRYREWGGYEGRIDQRWYNVVGVIADVKDDGPEQPTRPSVYLPFAQNGLKYVGTNSTRTHVFFAVVLRTSVDPSSITSAAREVLRRMDPDLAMTRVTTMSERLSNSMWLRRTYSWLVAVFAGLAVILVVSGLYGVISYTVSQRRREIAIRMTLGADQSRILNGVLKEAVVMASLGLAIGVASGWWSSRLFESLLFGVTATDPATYLTTLAIVGGVALMASLLPAIRAARTEPLSALRLD
jgi:predicted permease